MKTETVNGIRTKTVDNEYFYSNDRDLLLNGKQNGSYSKTPILVEELKNNNHKTKAVVQQKQQSYNVVILNTTPVVTDGNAAAPNAPSTNTFKSRRNLDQLLALRFHDEYKPTHQLGPDYVMPADKYWAVNPEDAVKLRLYFTGLGSIKPKSLITMFLDRVKASGEKIAMSVKKNDTWKHWTFEQFWQDAVVVGKAFLKLGLQRHYSVAILGFNSPEWFLSLWAAIAAGGMATGIYPTNSVEASKYILEHSRANIVVVENDIQLQKVLACRDQLPNLKAIIQYTGTPIHEDVFSWQDVMQLGRTVNDEHLHTRINSLAVNQAASTIYTSGTTGNPKAAMLSHDAYFANIRHFAHHIHFEEDERIVSFLPLNHVAAQFIDIFMAVDIGAHVYFAQPDAMKGSLIHTLIEAKPTFMLGVPRVWEKLQECFENHLSSANILKSTILKLAMNRAYKYSKSIIDGQRTKPYSYKLVEPVIKKMQAFLGLDKMRNTVCGGAPISEDMQKFYLHINIFLCDIYGMTECCCHCLNVVSDFRIGSVGKVSKHNELELQNVTEVGGEICCRGRSNLMGYMYDEKKTLEVLDADGWLHTGDIGKFDEDGFLYVTGRIKELLITSGGENIGPIQIEDNVKTALPLISQAVTIGDKRKYLCMLLTIKTEMDMKTMLPSDNLTPVTIKWCRSIGSSVETLQDLRQDEKVLKAIQDGINSANEKAISRACRIQKWRILPRDLTLQSDEIGPTMKLKRHVIHEHYKEIIEEMYA